jgi:CRISPR system Cascade subunit CasE
MFLSKISMDLALRSVALDLADRDRLHQVILRLFPDFPGGGAPNARERLGVLFRVEAPIILMQSKLEPVSTRIPAGYKITATKSISEIYPSGVKADKEYRFRLEANVCYRDSETRRRRPLETDEEHDTWLVMKGQRGGFQLVDYGMEKLPPVLARKGQFHAVRFDGVLKVNDLQPFLKALTDGIGPGKVYGLGLLSIGR